MSRHKLVVKQVVEKQKRGGGYKIYHFCKCVQYYKRYLIIASYLKLKLYFRLSWMITSKNLANILLPKSRNKCNPYFKELDQKRKNLKRSKLTRRCFKMWLSMNSQNRLPRKFLSLNNFGAFAFMWATVHWTQRRVENIMRSQWKMKYYETRYTRRTPRI